MFGYVRPLKGELKVAEYELFKAVYCGLCHSLGKRYGLPARFVLNYDLTFFATVLAAVEGETSTCGRRCIASPFRKKNTACSTASSDLAADLTVLLTYFKLEDQIRDKKGLACIFPFLLKLIMTPFFKSASRRRPRLSERIERSIRTLTQLEIERSPSIDKTADAFASILAYAVEEAETDEQTSRILRTMFYHIGRWIYIIDACDDYQSDMANNLYNPISCRYDIYDSVLPQEIKDEIEITLSHSMAAAASAFELIEWKSWEGLVANIIYKGLNAVTAEVLSGTWQRRSKADERPL
ncbi:MAG: DUF5685 family protein [Eubacteriales bacterium]|jgi:hypothetical protein